MDKSALNPAPHPSSVIDDEARQERVRARTRELASFAGREPWEVSQNDYEQAKDESMDQGARAVEKSTPTP
jgi:hypothetical protein